MFPNLREDIKRYFYNKNFSIKKVFYFLTNQGFWAILIYRFGYWTFHHCNILLINFILKIISFMAYKIIEILTGISIPFSTQIGKGLYIGHFGGIFINGKVKIGNYCSIGTGVVVGTKGLGDKDTPVIGNNVFIGVGAKVLGGIKIGNNVKIGANAVVISNIPDNSTAVGIPAIVKKEK